VQKHTLTPKWDEDLYVLVQEPKTQTLRVQMFDRDLLNVKARARQPRRRPGAAPQSLRNLPLNSNPDTLIPLLTGRPARAGAGAAERAQGREGGAGQQGAHGPRGHPAAPLP